MSGRNQMERRVTVPSKLYGATSKSMTGHGERRWRRVERRKRRIKRMDGETKGQSGTRIDHVVRIVWDGTQVAVADTTSQRWASEARTSITADRVSVEHGVTAILAAHKRRILGENGRRRTKCTVYETCSEVKECLFFSYPDCVINIYTSDVYGEGGVTRRRR